MPNSIWTYCPQECGLEGMIKELKSKTCLYCRQPLVGLRAPMRDPGSMRAKRYRVRVCQCCGWWSVFKKDTGEHYAQEWGTFSYGAAGTLLELDLSDIELPTSAVRAYLAAKWGSRFNIAPKLFEDTVGSVFRDLGYNVRITAYRNDGGIDVILDGPD